MGLVKDAVQFVFSAVYHLMVTLPYRAKRRRVSV